jgi:dTDP-4-amino-4,6-dideoxygalactose transaminase
MHDLGFNYRLTDFQAALGLAQLKNANKGLKLRRKIAQTYECAFKNRPYIKNAISFLDNHAYHLFIIEVEDRLGLYEYLRKNEIFAQIHYIPLHLMPFYQKYGWKEGDFPVAEAYYKNCISIPMYPTLNEEEQQFVIKSIYNFYGE